MTDAYLLVADYERGAWVRLVVTQQCAPTSPGFAPGCCLFPEQRQLFVGAGTRVPVYQTRSGRWVGTGLTRQSAASGPGGSTTT
jgi:hypothetical protein